MIRLIAAIDRQQGLAKHGILPWSIPDDENYFTEQTKLFGGNVLTGGRTFRETYHGPLADRQNFILTRQTDPIEGVTIVHDLLDFLKNFNHDLWIAGGANLFEQAINAGYADELYLTHIDANFGCDQFFPAYENKFKKVNQSEGHEQNGFRFTYAHYTNVN